jgi:hypothetical protein
MTDIVRVNDVNEKIKNIVDYVEFQVTDNVKGQTFIYFKLPAPVASIEQSKDVAEFVMTRPEWKGNRTPDSIVAEIYIHWIAENMKPFFMINELNQLVWKKFVIGSGDKRTSPISPIHLGYTYEGLDKNHPMDQFLLSL